MQKRDIVIYHNESSYSAFPEVTRRNDGEIRVYFGEVTLETLEGHGAEWAHFDYERKPRCYSSADGVHWLPCEKGASHLPKEGSGYITRLNNGDWLGSGFCYKFAHSEEELADFGPKWNMEEGIWAGECRGFVARSRDEGDSWDKEPTWLDTPSLYPFNGLMELADGTLLLPAQGRPKGEAVDSCFLMRSRDGGHTWQRFSTIAADSEGKVEYQEPCCLRRGGGRILAMLRTAGAGGYLHQAVSEDDGATWGGPRNTGIWGHPAHLLCLKSGGLLCVYGYRKEPFGIRACLSHDDGETWDTANEMVLRDDGQGWDLGYPRCVQLDNGSILAVYYFNHGTDCRFIAGTILEV